MFSHEQKPRSFSDNHHVQSPSPVYTTRNSYISYIQQKQRRHSGTNKTIYTRPLFSSGFRYVFVTSVPSISKATRTHPHHPKHQHQQPTLTLCGCFRNIMINITISGVVSCRACGSPSFTIINTLMAAEHQQHITISYRLNERRNSLDAFLCAALSCLCFVFYGLTR